MACNIGTGVNWVPAISWCRPTTATALSNVGRRKRGKFGNGVVFRRRSAIATFSPFVKEFF